MFWGDADLLTFGQYEIEPWMRMGESPEMGRPWPYILPQININGAHVTVQHIHGHKTNPTVQWSLLSDI